jgi:ribosome-associated protein
LTGGRALGSAGCDTIEKLALVVLFLEGITLSLTLLKLQRAVVTALEEIKGRDIEVFNVQHLTSMFDRVIIATGESTRQVKALGRSVQDAVKALGGKVLSIEGETTGEWVLVDLGDIVVHIMHPAIRQYYNLEELWGQAKPRAVRKRATTSK